LDLIWNEKIKKIFEKGKWIKKVETAVKEVKVIKEIKTTNRSS